MKLFLVVATLVISTVAKLDSRNVHSLEDKLELNKRQGNSHSALFNLVDSSQDGHVTADEFANFYVQYGSMVGLDLSLLQWRIVYVQIMNKIDSNWNDLLEITEFRKLPTIGRGDLLFTDNVIPCTCN